MCNEEYKDSHASQKFTLPSVILEPSATPAKAKVRLFFTHPHISTWHCVRLSLYPPRGMLHILLYSMNAQYNSSLALLYRTPFGSFGGKFKDFTGKYHVF